MFVLPVFVPLDGASHAMLVRRPLPESIHVLPHPLVFRVKQVHAVLTHAKPSRVDEIVTVATDVIAFIDDQRAQSELGARALGENTSGDSRADDDEIVLDVGVYETRERGEP